MSPIRVSPLEVREASSAGTDNAICPFLMSSLGVQNFGAGIPWAEVSTTPGMSIMSTESASDENIALHLLNAVVPPVDRLPSVTDCSEMSGFARRWLHQEALAIRERVRVADSLMELGSDKARLVEQVGKLRGEVLRLEKTRPAPSVFKALRDALDKEVEKSQALEQALLLKTNALTAAEASNSELKTAVTSAADDLKAALEKMVETQAKALEEVEAVKKEAEQALLAEKEHRDAALEEVRKEAEIRRTRDVAAAVSAYKGSPDFTADAVKHATDKVLKALGDLIDQILVVQPDFPIDKIPLLKVALKRREAAATSGEASAVPPS